MAGPRNPLSSQDRSRFLSMLNALMELRFELEVLDVSDEARETLGQLIETCRAEYKNRPGSKD